MVRNSHFWTLLAVFPSDGDSGIVRINRKLTRSQKSGSKTKYQALYTGFCASKADTPLEE